MRWIQTVDNWILGFIQNHIRCRFLDRVMPVLTSLGNGGAIWLIITAVWLARAGTRRMGFLLLAVLLVCVAVGNFGIKLVAARKRPVSYGYGVLAPDQPAVGLFISILSYNVVLWRSWRDCVNISPDGAPPLWCWRRSSDFPGYTWYVHYPSDVLAGLVLGLLAAGFIVYFV